MKILNIVECAYRATTEEQDDTIVWISHALKGAGADLTVLLEGAATNYASRGQSTPALTFGSWEQTHPSAVDRDLTSLLAKGVAVLCVEDDARERGLDTSALLDGVELVSRAGLPALLRDYDQIWRW